ncbi:TPA: restriction endonuclease subunit S [Providencia rettgeri]|nr:restriction endonuclease subunit S [Providencia rettgeri]
MGSEWITYSVDEIATVKSGKRLPKDESLTDKKTSYPYIRLVDVNQGKIDASKIQYLESKTQNKISRYIVEANDVCLAIVGHTIGMVFYVEDEWNNANLTENAARLTDISSSFNPRYIYYYLISPVGQSEIISRKVGSAQGKLPLYNIKELKIKAPDRITQDHIVDVLLSLDNKITLNRQINQTLEQMAQTLFKSWFVDFDPVIDNALDTGFFEQDLAFSDELQRRVEVRKAARESDNFKPLSEDIRQLFPDAFEECAEPVLGLGGWVPKGWEILTLSKLSKIASGKRPPTKGTVKTEEEPIPVWGGNGIKWFTDKPLSTGKYIITGRVGTLGTVYKVDGPSWASDNALVIKPLQHEYFEFIYQTLCNFDIHSLNSGSTQPLVTQTALSGIQLIFPRSTKLLLEYQKSINIYDEKFKVNSNEVESLTQLRDTLLPKLISGELSLSDIKIDIPEEILI